MKKVLLVLAFIATAVFAKAQVGIGTNDPKASLDVQALNLPGIPDGILVPRITRDRASKMTNVDHATLIYVTDAVGFVTSDNGIASNVNTKGFYFFNHDIDKWVKMPDFDQALDATYWKAQKSSSPKAEGESKAGPTDLVSVDIYQKGKVGIGYDSGNEIDFETNKAQKQLEVGGDFRTVHTIPGTTPRYIGIETNSKYAPDQYNTAGTILYNANKKDLRNLFSLTEEFNGNALIQDRYGLSLANRSGVNKSLDLTLLDLRDYEISLIATKGVETKELVPGYEMDMYEKHRNLNLNTDLFRVVDQYILSKQMGYDFEIGKFYLGNPAAVDDGTTIIHPKNQYYFPQSRPAKDNQILKYSQATESLEWADASGGNTSPSSQFFYMPSIIINTSVNGTGLKRNLHAEYVAQFTGKEFVPNTTTGGTVETATSTKFIKSDGAPATIPNIPTATGLYYYITDYDKTALANLSIDANGILTYDVIGTGTDYSFVNIVFVVK